MTHISLLECTCSCHRDSTCRHFMACCYRCDKCGKNISVGAWYATSHSDNCTGNARRVRAQPDRDIGAASSGSGKEPEEQQ